MKGAIHLALLPLTCVGLGCATTLDVVVDEHEDLSLYRSWDFVPALRNADTPPIGAGALNAAVALMIAHELGTNDFARVAEGADFLVEYQLTVLPHEVTVNVPMAPYLLDSHDSSASYWIEGSRKEIQIHRNVRLAIAILNPEGRFVWRALLVRNVEPGRDLEIADSVARILEDFAAAVHASSKIQ